ncbi:Tetratrico peptide repeat-containing protein [Terribacillus saccharophilus]|uniref:Tetratrico peptide repeat-containing protein n=1 Tax=Terribacillus saccharophilus TaxID=361277 RepID=A0AAX2EH77_9BACI|nr:Tetratrico peptide repeat-containing protein [Terribacillus saccharophilus]
MNELFEAISLREAGKLAEANERLIELASAYPDNAEVQYQCAWSFDVLGQETAAVPFYERGIALGLPKEHEEGAYLGLGSTYRTLGNYKKAEQTLKKAMNLFPKNNAFPVFYAMVKYNQKEHGEAMQILLQLLAETTSDNDILEYQKAITFYADKLDIVWS